MSTDKTDEKLRQILGASPRNHQSCVDECKKAYKVNVQNCQGDAACLSQARSLLQTCIDGCPSGIVRERAAEIVKIIVGED
jgi:hypothetical protein